MTAPTRSVLLVDYDSLHQSLAGAGPDAAARLAPRAPAWLAAISSGQLLGPAGAQRTIPVKRCYANPMALGPGGAAFILAEFSVTDCPPAVRSSRLADINLVIDAVQALADPAGYDEFILLSAEPVLAPLLARLKAAGRRTAIYADATTTPGQRALADQVLEVGSFADFLLAGDQADIAADAGPDRGDIEAFARRIQAASNIPLLSPKAYAELFRLLSEEIATNGYHFQTTAKNVADRLAAIGRSVTRRQVVFIVKGLALKGHVYVATDTPRQLAEAFREQARYLIGNAGIVLDAEQERLLAAWLVDKVPARAAPSRPRVSAASATAESIRPLPSKEEPAPQSPTIEGFAPDIVESASPAVSIPAAPPMPPPATATVASAPLAESPAKSSPMAAKGPGAEQPPAAEVRAADTTRPTKTDAADTPPAGPEATAVAATPAATEGETAPKKARAPTADGKSGKAMISPDDAKAAIAARVTSVRPKPTPTSLPAPKPVAEASSPEPDPRSALTPEHAQAIESSILAAIAQAVDVLVEDSGTPETPQPPARKQPAALPPPPAAVKQRAKGKSEAEADGDTDDIGNEIQRIIATYNRTRKDAPRK